MPNFLYLRLSRSGSEPLQRKQRDPVRFGPEPLERPASDRPSAPYRPDPGSQHLPSCDPTHRGRVHPQPPSHQTEVRQTSDVRTGQGAAGRTAQIAVEAVFEFWSKRDFQK